MRAYFAESLFLNQVKYENDKLEVLHAQAREEVDADVIVRDSVPTISATMSLNYLATRFTCSWPWSIAVMLCDGRIVCGCADPYAKRVLGDFRTTSLTDIWRGPIATELRDGHQHAAARRSAAIAR